MGDLESQPISEIMDQDDDQSNSFFDLTNIPSHIGEEYEYDNYDEEKEKKVLTKLLLFLTHPIIDKRS